VELGPYSVPGFYTGDCRALMADLPEGCVQMVVTSPPYWGLRVYSGEQSVPWDDGSRCPFGNEDTPEAYVAHTVEVLAAINRVLRDDGVCFWNVGDSYATPKVGNTQENVNSAAKRDGLHEMKFEKKLPPGLKPKDLCLIPHRVAIAAQADGWYVRSDIIWAKPNPMPESVTDRPTSAHEHVIMLTKSARYFWDADGVREEAIWAEHHAKYHTKSSGRTENNKNADNLSGDNGGLRGLLNESSTSGRNIRNVWTIPTRPYSGAHFAVFPPKLPETCIKAATPVKCCAECGAPWERVVERGGSDMKARYARGEPARHGTDGAAASSASGVGRFSGRSKTTGHRPACKCEQISGEGISMVYNDDGSCYWAPPTRPAIVLDPFCGSGTTCAVAEDLGRLWIGFDISEEYRELQAKRTEQRSLMGALLTATDKQ